MAHSIGQRLSQKAAKSNLRYLSLTIGTVHLFLKIVITSIILHFSRGSQAQLPWRYMHYSTSDGLSNDDTMPIVQDDLGFIWIGTKDGLNRFDGYEFKNFYSDSTTTSITDNRISWLLWGSDKQLWIASEGGLCSMDPVTEKVTRYDNIASDGTPINRVKCVIEDRQGKIWVTYDNLHPSLGGVARFDPSTGEYTNYLTDINIGAINIIQDNVDDNVFWVCAWGSVLRLEADSGEYELLVCPNCEHESYTYQWIEFLNGQELIVTSVYHGVYSFHKSTKEWRQISDQMGGLTLKHKEGDDWWLTTQGDALVVLDASTGITEKRPIAPDSDFAFPIKRAKHLLEDRNGTLWVSHRAGVSAIKPEMQRFHVQDFSTDLDDGEIYMDCSTITADGQHLIAFSERKVGAFVLNAETGEVVRHLHHFTHGGFEDLAIYALDLQPYTDSLLVFSNKEGLFSLNLHTWETRTLVNRELLEFDSWGGNFDLFENKVCIDGWNEQFIIHDLKTGETQLTNFAKIDRARSRSVGRPMWGDANKVWLPTNDMPGYFDFEKAEYILLEDIIDIDLAKQLPYTKALCPLGDSLVYFTSQRKGLTEVNVQTGLIRQVYTPNGSDNYYAVHVVLDNENNIWSTTSKGLVHWNTKTKKASWFTNEDGIPQTAIYTAHLEKAMDGSIIYGNSKYVVWFKPEDVLGTRVVDPVRLIQFNGPQDFQATAIAPYMENISLSAGMGSFSFTYASINSRHAQDLQYSYSLEGFEEDWNHVDDRRLGIYTNIPGGDYTLKIRSRHPEGNWNEPVELSVQIDTVLAKTWWFRLTLAIVVLLVILIIMRARTRRVKEKQAIKSQFEQRIAEVEMTALRAQMNPHFLFNCLNSIKYFIIKNRSDEAADYLTKFSRLIRLILNNSKSELVKLDAELEALELYIEMESLRFSKHFAFSITVDPAIQTEFIEIPPLLLQPFVENAIWHGLMHKEGDGLLEVEILYEDTNLRCVIRDNGVGREKARKLKSKTSTKRKSLGMQITSDRIQAINDLYQTEAKMQIKDLVNDHGHALGTEVTVTIPI
jgi:ligand-binding sensor domain-containing protein